MDVDELELEALEAPAPGTPEADIDGIEYADPFEEDTADFVSDDGDTLPEEVRAELEALASEEFDEGAGALEAALAEAQRELARQRNLTRQAVARYRDALLAAEPDLPPDLVRGDTLEDIEATATSARDAVQRIRERVASERPRGFPVGAPARSVERGHAHSTLSAHEKIAAGLQERLI
jgi:hypothetical protein